MKKLKTALFILLACILAILSKIILPSEVNAQDFDSFLVTKLGFPIVASLYFVMIYSHNAIVAAKFSEKSKLSNFQCGLRTGLSFGLIYLLGMEEVVVESSPFSEWGLQFVGYQFVMGIGEAVMALLLCFCITRFVSPRKEKSEQKVVRTSVKNDALAVILITVFFFIERTILYNTGLISSDVKTYPLPTYVWTIIFGATLGFCFCLLKPLIDEEKSIKMCAKVCVLAIGLCWIGFNLFIAFIFKDSLGDILIRCITDVIFVFSAALLWIRMVKKDEKISA